MAVLSDTDRDWIRDWVGSTPDDGTLDDYYDQLGAREAVALRVLNRRLADMQANPASFSLSGVLSTSTVANLTALEKKITRLEGIANAAGVTVQSGATAGVLYRADRLRCSPYPW